MSIFVHCYEAFLGVPPSLTLVRHLLHIKVQPSNADPAIVGGAGFQMCDEAQKVYFEYSLPDTQKVWKGSWFYMGYHSQSLK